MSTPPSYAITGIQAGRGPAPGQVPLRVDVDDFFTKNEYSVQLNLFYLAMVKFQAIPYGENLSYFQVAGIHGLPHVQWDAWPTRGYHPQYCEHGTILFGTWHRPYLALFEQRLYEIMLSDVIPGYNADTQVTLRAQAAEFRLPYWDWAVTKIRGCLPIYDLPLIVQKERVQVTTPTGQSEIPNPLWCFRVSSAAPMGEYGVTPVQVSDDNTPYDAAPSDRAFATSRCPPNPGSSTVNMTAFINGVQNNTEAGNNLREANWYQSGTSAYTVGEAVYRILSLNYFSTYKNFVTTAYEPRVPNRRDYMSLEAVHNNIHNWTGGAYGHMAIVPIAAFDPIFWLHHANIDRLLAIWQGLNPTKWWVPGDVGGDPTKLPTTPLVPFHSNTTRTVYTSDTSRSQVAFGYTYPELQRWNYPSEEAYITSIRAAVQRLYGPDPATQAVTTYGDYIVNIKFERFALEGDPFTVIILLNNEVVGSVYNFSARLYNDGRQPGCENCERQKNENTEVTGQVSITHALRKHFLDAKYDALTEFNEEAVSKYLKENLTWKVVTPTRREVPLEKVPSLTVSVATGRRAVFNLQGTPDTHHLPLDGGIAVLPGMSEKVLLGSDADWGDMHGDHETIRIGNHHVALQGWGDYKVLPDVTHGRPGGLVSEDVSLHYT